jgi:hypothetical protein
MHYHFKDDMVNATVNVTPLRCIDAHSVPYLKQTVTSVAQVQAQRGGTPCM